MHVVFEHAGFAVFINWMGGAIFLEDYNYDVSI